MVTCRELNVISTWLMAGPFRLLAPKYDDVERRHCEREMCFVQGIVV